MNTTEERPGDFSEALHEAGQPVCEHSAEAVGYPSSHGIYRTLGWRVLPLPPRAKKKPPPGFTGRGGSWPSEEQMDEWARNRPHDSNICVRLDEQTIGIDVDAYDDKTGAQALDEAEKRWGPLPPTVMSSSRDDGVSGIRLYRVPAGTVLRGGIQFDEIGVGDIDLVQRHLRYVMCWPSVHPTTNSRYVWRDGDGRVLSSPPAADDLPALPDTWIKALRQENVEPQLADLNSQHALKQTPALTTRAMTEGRPSSIVAQCLAEALNSLDRGHCRHDTVRGYVMALLRHGTNGESGIEFALNDLKQKFVSAVGPDRPGGEAEAEAEFERLISGAGYLLDEPATSPSTQTRSQLRDSLLNVGQLRRLPRVRPLIRDLLYQDTLAQLAGPPGSYKSFATVAMACAVATGHPFGTHVVPRAGTVVYVAAEGSNNMAARILAWCEVNKVDPESLDGHLHVLPVPVQLGDAVDVSQVVEIVRDVDADLLVLDTRARCTLGLEENSATEQGKAIAAAEEIRAAACCTVLGVHHSGASSARGRGSTAWDGAVWSDLRMDGKALQATIRCEKHKDVPSGCAHTFGLVRHTVSVELMPGTLPQERETLVLSGTTGGIESPSANSHRVVLEIIRTSAPPEGFTGPQVIALAKAEGVGQSSAYAALKSLVAECHLRQVGSKSRSRYVAAADGCG